MDGVPNNTVKGTATSMTAARRNGSDGEPAAATAGGRDTPVMLKITHAASQIMALLIFIARSCADESACYRLRRPRAGAQHRSFPTGGVQVLP
jgi:hypothetical protein